MRWLSLLSLLLVLGCKAAPAPDVDAPVPAVPAPPQGEDLADMDWPVHEGRTWFYAADEAALHASHLDALRNYTGVPAADNALIARADAFEAGGASWGLSEGGKVLVVPRATGPRIRMDSSDPHAIGDDRRYYDLDAQQLAAWAALDTQRAPVHFAPAYRRAFMAPLQNDAACQRCHKQDAPGTILGAWIYSLDEIADD